MGGDTFEGIRQRIFKRDNHRCVYCGATAKLEIDHIVARSNGGSDDDDNLATACKSCNVSKNNRGSPTNIETRQNTVGRAVMRIGGVRQVAGLCGVSTQAVYKWIEAGRLANIRHALLLADAADMSVEDFARDTNG